MSNNIWMPPKGRRSVTAGSSFTRALNARKSKGTAPAPKSLYLRDFYSFRYNFRPPSVDPGERGRIVVKKGKDSTSVTVERPSTQSSEAHQWLGTEIPAKEWDCVLIYDEVSDTYTLEKLDSHMALTHQHKPVPIEPTAPPAEALAKRPLTYEEELERELVAAAEGDEDADGDDDFEEIVPKLAVRMEEEEEEEEILKPPSPPPKPTRAVKPAASAPPPSLPPPPPVAAPIAVPTPKPRAVAPAARPKAAPPARAKKQKREPEPLPLSNSLSDADEEDLEFGQPAKRTKHSPLSEGLALPSSSTSLYTPPPPMPHVTRPSPPPPAVEPGSESDEEWDEIAPAGADAATEDDFDIFDDLGGGDVEAEGEAEDIDVNEFEREINQQMDEESDEDFLAAVVEEAPPRGAPVSLKELAIGAAYVSDDDYSSSEDSDDD